MVGTANVIKLRALLRRLIIFCVWPLVLVAVGLAIEDVINLHEKSRTEAAQTIQNFTTAIDRNLANRIAILNVLAASPLIDDPPKLAAFHKEAQRFRLSFGGEFVVADASMQMLLNTRSAVGAPLPKLPQPKGYAAAPAAVASGKPAVGDMFLGNISNQPSLAIVVPVIRDGSVRLLLLNVIEASQLQKRLDEFALPANWALTVYDGAGAVLARRAPPGMPVIPVLSESRDRIVVKSNASRWSVAIDIPGGLFREESTLTIVAVTALVLIALFLSIYGGAMTSSRLERAIASLSNTDSARDSDKPEIAEVAAARQAMNEEAAARMQVESRLRESEQRLNFALQTSQIGAWELNLQDHTAHRTLIHDRIFGYESPPPDWTYERFLEHVLPEDRRQVAQSFVEATGAHTAWDFECRIRRADGVVRWIWAAGGHEHETEGEPARISGVVQDITERKRAQEALREREALLRTLTEHARIGMVMVTTDHRYVFANAAYADVLGLTTADIIGKQVSDVLAPVYDSQIRPRLDRAFAGERVAYELAVPPAGKWENERHFAVAYEPPVQTVHGPCVIVMVMDITERKRSEQAQAQLAAIVESSNDAIVSRAPDDTILSWNAGAERMFGWSAAEALGKGFRRLLSVTPDADRRRRFEKVVLGDAVATLEDTRRRKDGSKIVVDTTLSAVRDKQGNIVFVSCIMRDITLRRQAEEMRTQLAAIVESSNDAIVSRTPDDTIISWNAAAERLFGWTAQEALGKSFRSLLYKTPEAPRKGRFAKALRGDSVATLDDIRRHKDGSCIVVDTTLSPVKDNQGNIVSVSCIMRDITLRRQAEETRNQLAAIVENSNDAIYSRALDGTILSWNEGAHRMLGYSAAEAIGRLGYFTVPPSRPSQLERINERLLRGDVVTHESDRVTKDGQVIDVLVSHSPVRDNAGTIVGVSIIMRDITALKRAEAEHRRLAAAVEGSNDAIFLRDMAGHIVFWNESATRLYGYTRDEVMGQNSALLVPADRLEERELNWRQIEQGKLVESFETVRVRKDRTLLDVSISVAMVRDQAGKAIGSATIARDITARKRAELVRAQLATIVENAYDAIISLTLDGTIISWNAAAEALFGYSASEAIGQSFNILMPPGEQFDGSGNADLLRKGLHVPSAEVVRRTRDGRLIDVTRSISPVRNDAGEVTGAAVILHDVTTLKQAEAKRVSLEAQLRESQKMEAIGTLAGGIAHDFNNIIATILGNVKLACADTVGNLRALESLEEIRKASTRARDLVQQILSFSRRHPTERKRISLGPVVTEAGRLLRATLPARLTLDVQCDANVPMVVADATQIQQIVLNLATNAMQAIRQGAGRIAIRLDAIMLDVALAQTHPALGALHTKHPGRTVRLTVSDTGPGMDAATVKRVFEPFFTTKPAGEGTGLGLSVVHGIVAGHEGAVVVDSQPGTGTTFTIYLPSITAPAHESDSGTGLPATTPTQRRDRQRHILYFDDDESLAFLVTRMLKWNGCRVSAYTDQRRGLDALRANPHDFDLVVSDYNMPGMSGLDVAREVRAIRPDLPVAVASGFIDETLRAQAEGAGVHELIFKANSAEDFCDILHRLANAAGEAPISD